MKSFEYAAPYSLEEAVGLLSDQWGESEVLAGGTDLVTSMKQAITQPKRLVSLKNLTSLKSIRLDNGTLRIGSLASLADVAEHAAVREHFPAIEVAIRGIGGRQMIVRGTAGGDLCQRPRCWYFRNGYGLFGQQDGRSLVLEGDNRYHAIFGNDGPAYFVSPSSLGPPLVALGAEISVVGPDGAGRKIPAKDFFKIPKSEGERETALRPNEVVTEIRVPVQGLANATYEVRHRHGLDWPYVTASVAIRRQGDRSAEGRVVLGQVAPIPWVAERASAELSGASLSSAIAAQCGQAAIVGAQPLSGNGYKVQLTKAAVRRAVLAAAGIGMEV